MTRAFLLVSAAALLTAQSAFAATTVPVAHFDSIELRGGGHVVLRHGTQQSVTLVKGSTDYTTFQIDNGSQLVIDACNSHCPNSYDLEIEIVSPDVKGAAVSGGGSIEAQGDFPGQGEVDAAVSGGGSVDLRAMHGSSVNAAVDGGGHIKVATDGALNAAVNGGGNVTYWGNPQVQQVVAGGGTISRAD